MPLLRTHPVRIQPYFGFRSRSRLVLSARALRAPAPGFEGGNRLTAIRTMLAQFVTREARGVSVTLELQGQGRTLVRETAKTDDAGFVHFELALEPERDLPKDPVWEVVSLCWTNREGPQQVAAKVLVPGSEGRLGVISDIDDTIIETGISGSFSAIARNWRRILAQMPGERVAVGGADAFYGALGGGPIPGPAELRAGQRVPATHRPFFYVSSSPWNLFSYLVAFQRAKGLPLGPLMLRDWGLNRETLGSSSHGAHKRRSIDAILAMYPDLRFALIGDDTQGDLPAYAAAVEHYPLRVAAVFIRTTAGETFSQEEEAARALIEAAGVPLWLGESWETGQDFLRSVGFTPGGETEQIVRAVDKVPTAVEGG